MGKALYNGKPLRPSQYIGGIDVMDADLDVTIKKIDPRQKGFKGQVAAVICVDTPEGVKFVRINATRETELVELFGPRAKEWLGKKIRLWFDPSIKFGGKRVGGVRIKKAVNGIKHSKKANTDESADLLSGLLIRIAKTRSADKLTELSGEIKASRDKLTAEDIKELREAYKMQADLLEEQQHERHHNDEGDEF